MKTVRILGSVASLAFIAGFWAACSIGFDPTTDDYKFSCVTDQDCVSTHQCAGGVCTRTGKIPDCIDNDEDGYGTGDTGDCPKCVQEGLCDVDCNDEDAAINPGLLDTCDGKDNNCNDEIDEPIPCEDNFGCPDEQPYIPSCTNNVCIYKPPNQLGGAECQQPVACADGERQAPGDQCF